MSIAGKKKLRIKEFIKGASIIDKSVKKNPLTLEDIVKEVRKNRHIKR